MGKSRWFIPESWVTDPHAYSEVGELPRSEFLETIEDEFQCVDPQMLDDLRHFAATADRVGFGFWVGRDTETGEQCRCPVASISVPTSDGGRWNAESAAKGAWSRWDEAMQQRTGYDAGILVITD